MRDAERYEKLGFICGLEIHQRLATKEKLFCGCSASLVKDVSVAEIERRQRAVAGELGAVDASAEFESSRQRGFVYNTFRNETCLVDVDEEPPHALNREALQIALKIAAALRMLVPDEFEPMRKSVVDGSDPSAFQRTLLIGYDGCLEVNNRKIKIPLIFLEEESSGISYSDSNVVVYNTDRLAVPLIEIDTAPEIRTPEEAMLVARKIGLLLRLTGKVQRGIGSIRQDVNVSITGGNRVEIKGFQELETMPKIIESEIERQLKLIEAKRLLNERDAKVGAPLEVTYVFAKTGVDVIKKSMGMGSAVYALRLQGFKGMLGFEINLGRRLGSEISDYAKLAGVGGIIHSDEKLDNYGFSSEELEELRKELKLGSGDAFILIAGERGVCKSAMSYAKQRAEYALIGVPRETRNVDTKLLITKFERPLPSGSRMYPETDARPVSVDKVQYLSMLGETIDIDKIAQGLVKQIGNKQLAEQMLWSPYFWLYNRIISTSNVSGSVVAPILLEKMKDLRRSGVDVDSIPESALISIFAKYEDGSLTKAAIEELLKHTPKTEAEIDQLISRLGLRRISGSSLKSLVAQFGQKSRNEAVREIMSKYRLNVDGAELNELLKQA